MKNIIIGSAGHIDHGKTALIEHLTGKNTDTLPEEKKRGLTIDIGFSHIQLENKTIGIIDVPGHEKFIKNMTAGTSSIDFVMLVIACDDGIMPQTIEHLNIVSLLGIKYGVVVLTKKDLVDQERLAVLKSEVKELIKDSFLKDAKICEVSIKDPQSIEDFKKILSDEIKKITSTSSKNKKFRLDIDRVFSVKGFGTVVTGTSKNSTVNVGDKLILYPQLKEVIVKGIESHNKKFLSLEAGNRCALNLAGVEVKEIHRGDSVAEKDSLYISDRVDCLFYSIKNSIPIKNNSRVHLNIGTAEVIGRIKIFEKDSILPNETPFIQIELEKTINCNIGDRGIVRNYSPVTTIGGIEIITPIGKKIKRKDKNYLEYLKNIVSNNKSNKIENILKNEKNMFLSNENLNIILGETVDKISLLEMKNIKNICDSIFIHKENLETLKNNILDYLKLYHQKNSLSLGVKVAEIKSKFFKNSSNKIYQNFLKLLFEDNLIKEQKNLISLFEFKPKLNKDEKKIKDQIFSIYKTFGFKPQNIDNIIKNNSTTAQFKKVHQFMVDYDFIIYLGDGIYILRGFFLEAKKIVISFLKENKQITLKEVSTILNTNRKVSLLLLEKLDEEKITKRIDNYRILLQGDGFND